MPEYHFEVPINQCLQEIIGQAKVLAALPDLSAKKFRQFAIQRYIIAKSFEPLLERAIHLSKGLEIVHTVLQQNLDDEIGRDANGKVQLQNAHATWRRYFYEAIGITEPVLKSTHPLKGTQEYQEMLEGLIASNNVYLLIGAILALEVSIPAEFKRIQKARDAIFPEVFVDRHDDSEEVKLTKHRARLYIDDHIIHDAQRHYPDLIAAIKVVTLTVEAYDYVLAGMNTIKKAKQVFYQDLATQLAID